jgi:hypothetical protein
MILKLTLNREDKMMRKMVFGAVLIAVLVAFSSSAQDMEGTKQMTEEDKPFLLTYSNLDEPQGRVILTNEHVVLQRLVVPAGEWEGVHSHPGNQLYVHVKGGYWSGKMAGEMVYSHELSETGSIGWMDAIAFSEGHNSGNTGEVPIDLIWITSKSGIPLTPEKDLAPQVYPNIPLEVKLENNLMIVQRGTIDPGQWTGPHSRSGNQIYILIKGGNLSERQEGEEAPASPFLGDGTPGWLDATPLSEAHNFGNTGETTIDLVLITIK